MREADGGNSAILREGTPADAAACLALWVEACAARDGASMAGVAERARLKFNLAESWMVAEDPELGVMGFLLVTTVGSGLLTDPSEAPVVALLAVAPGAQGRGLGSSLLSAITAELARRGYKLAVLHVLVDNYQAVRLYESKGWQPLGEPFQHSLLKRPTQTYALVLHSSRVR